MGSLEALLENPLFTFGVIGGGALFLIVLVLVRKRKASTTSKGYAESGNYLAAANQAQKDKNYEAALEYFLLARQPVRAAQMARLLGRLQQAGEIYESAGELERAATMYRDAGVPDQAERVLKESAARAERQSDAGERDSGHDTFSDSGYAEKIDKKFTKVLADAKNGSIEAQAELLELGREAAEAFLAAGDTSRAAEIFRDAGLIDQAINLYVNLLGDFGAAGALFAQRGDHERAADMFEMAGLKERALAAWIKWAEDAADPLEHLEALDRLGEDETNQFLDTIIDSRPLEEETLDLHYRIAEALEVRKAHESAFRILKKIDRTNPGYRDVSKRLEQLDIVIRGEEEEEPDIELEPHRFEGGPELPPGALVRHEMAWAGDPARQSDRDLAAGSPRPSDQEAVRLDGGAGSPLLALPARPSPRPGMSEGMHKMVETAVGNHVALDEQSWNDENRPARGRPPVRIASAGAGGYDQTDGELKLGSPTLEKLVQEVVSIAIEEAKRVAHTHREDLAGGIELRMAHPSASARANRTLALGLERQKLELKLVTDPAVARARSGPPVVELEQMLGDAEPSLQNIEVWYRLGLAYAASAEWTRALEAFNIVEDISPGYRDAIQRAKELEQWRASMSDEELGDASLSERYRLMGELGRGGMAVVYRARDEALGREVALKFLSEEVSRKKGMIDLFQREARAAAQLNHPNIVTVYDVGVLSGRAFIAMELVTGKTVEDLLDERGRLSVMDGLRISENILSALEYAHNKQLVHRDVKPSNMMRSEQGVVKLMDFGLAKSFGSGERTTAICGTPLYMAPEQFTGKNIDPRTDLFAFGAGLYEMLSGQPPFEDIRRDIEPPRLRSLNPSVPKVIDAMVHRSLEFHRERRFNSAAEMLKIVRFILEKVSTHFGEKEPQKKEARPDPGAEWE